jgi:hypothetical protein
LANDCKHEFFTSQYVKEFRSNENIKVKSRVYLRFGRKFGHFHKLVLQMLQ